MRRVGRPRGSVRLIDMSMVMVTVTVDRCAFLVMLVDRCAFIRSDASLSVTDAVGRVWLEGWIGHGRTTSIQDGDRGFGEGTSGFRSGYFPADMVRLLLAGALLDPP